MQSENDDLLAIAHYSCTCAVAEFARGKGYETELPGILQEYWDLSGEPYLTTYYDWARPEYADVCLAELAWRSLRQAGFHVQVLATEPEALTAHVRALDAATIEGRIEDALPPWLGVRMASCFEAGNCTWLVRLELELPEPLTDEKGAEK